MRARWLLIYVHYKSWVYVSVARTIACRIGDAQCLQMLPTEDDSMQCATHDLSSGNYLLSLVVPATSNMPFMLPAATVAPVRFCTEVWQCNPAGSNTFVYHIIVVTLADDGTTVLMVFQSCLT